jgi:hypothetical protein
MNKSLFAIAVFGCLAALSSQARAHDERGCDVRYQPYVRYYDQSGCYDRERSEYERREHREHHRHHGGFFRQFFGL